MDAALESMGAPSPLHGRLRAQGGGAHRVQKGGGAHCQTRRSGARRRPRASGPGAAAAKDHLFKGSQDHPGLVTIAMEDILQFAASIGGGGHPRLRSVGAQGAGGPGAGGCTWQDQSQGPLQGCRVEQQQHGQGQGAVARATQWSSSSTGRVSGAAAVRAGSAEQQQHGQKPPATGEKQPHGCVGRGEGAARVRGRGRSTRSR
ncbi:uncharacterized protein [Triticum aestivum]|uniref:uncharacterized protein n=1 Tax=Triticum aestivum TaxID=4565 RepID=UPI001D001F24|nr:uncharacterized protein LOC123155608 [Triticum aestivum]